MDLTSVLARLFIYTWLVLPANTFAVASTLGVDDKLVLELLKRVEHLEVKDKEQQVEIATLRGTVKQQSGRLAELEKRDADVRIDALDRGTHFDKHADVEKLSDETREEHDVRTVTADTIKTAYVDMRRPGADFRIDAVDSATRIVDGPTGISEGGDKMTMKRDNNEEHSIGTGKQTRTFLRNIDHRNRQRRQGRQRRQTETNNVAFYAVVDTHHLKNLGANQRIEFDRAVTNIGNAFHPNLGVFICPVGGTYVFSTSLMGINHDNSHYYIALNDHAVANMFIHGQDSYLTTTSRTIVLSLNKGDEVSVRNMNITEGVFGYQFSSFSGFLIGGQDFTGSAIVG